MLRHVRVMAGRAKDLLLASKEGKNPLVRRPPLSSCHHTSLYHGSD